MALVLHAHLPYVRHPEYERFLEENWLFEALSETYLPLLRVFRGLERDGIPFRLTLSLSPTLTSMFEDELLCRRYTAHLDRLIELGERELERTAGDPALSKPAAMYHELFRRHSQGISAFSRIRPSGLNHHHGDTRLSAHVPGSPPDDSRPASHRPGES